MKLAFLGDRHVSSRSPRYRHALAMWDFAIDDAITQGATAFVGLGDVCEGDPNGEERYELGRLYKKMLRAGPVFEVLGNHESREALRWLEHLGVTVAWQSFLHTNPLGIRLLFAPYARRGHAPYQECATHEESAARLARAIEVHQPHMVAGHWTIEGMRCGDSDFEIHHAHEMVVPREALAGTTLTVVGHIHAAQEVGEDCVCGHDALCHMKGTYECQGFSCADLCCDCTCRKFRSTIIGAGSLYRVSFAERDDPKSYVLVDVAGDRITWTRRPVPAREQIVETLDWQPSPSANAVAATLLAMQAPGKEVKLTVRIREDQLASYDASVFSIVKEAAELFILERETLSIQRTRVPGLVAKHSVVEQLAAWGEATGVEMRASVREKAQEVIG